MPLVDLLNFNDCIGARSDALLIAENSYFMETHEKFPIKQKCLPNNTPRQVIP